MPDEARAFAVFLIEAVGVDDSVPSSLIIEWKQRLQRAQPDLSGQNGWLIFKNGPQANLKLGGEMAKRRASVKGYGLRPLSIIREKRISIVKDPKAACGAPDHNRPRIVLPIAALHNAAI